MKLPVITSTGKASQATVSAAVFGAESNPQLLSQAVRVYLSNRRQGTSKVQTRSEVSLTKSKWYKQKGTGNARHGAKSAPLFVGGGVAHGPTGLQNWKKSLPPRMKVQALAQACTAQVAACSIIDDLESLSGKTKEAAARIAQAAPKAKSVLIVTDSASPTMLQALANLKRVRVVSAAQVTALDVAAAQSILFTPKAIEVIEGRVTGKTTPVKTATVAKKSAKKAEKTTTKKKTTK